KRPERREAEPRTVHFDDGRPSQRFVPTARDKRDEAGDGKPRREGFKGNRPDDKPFGDRPRKPGGKPPFAKGPRDRDGEGERPKRFTRAEGADRPARKDSDRPFAKRTGPKTDKAFGDRPPRRDGDRPFAKGPRRDGAPSDRPFSKGPRREGASGDRPFSKGPRRDGPGAERPFSKGPRRENGGGDRPFAKGPRREGGNDRPT